VLASALNDAVPSADAITLQPHAPILTERASRRGILVLCLLLLAAIVAAHAGLIPMGRWQGDEYLQAALSRDYGASFLLGRIFGGSPRPVSEVILFGYFALVDHLRRPLIGSILVLLWAALLASTVVTLRPALRSALPYRLLLAVSILAMFLVGHPVSELFFWPVGAAAYLTTLAAMTCVFFMALDGRTETQSGRAMEAALLVVAAACSEAGAMFVLALSVLRLFPAARRAEVRSANVVCWVAPFAMTLFVIYCIVASRVGGVEEVSPGAPYMHHAGASLLAAVPQFAREIVGLSADRTSAADIVAALLIKSLFFVGFRWCVQRLDQARPPSRGMAIFALALLGAAFEVIAAANYQFGSVCCERHDSLRQCWFILALAALASWSTQFRLCGALASAAPVGSAPVWSAPVGAGPVGSAPVGAALLWAAPVWAAPIPLALAALLPFAARLPDLVHDYQLYPAAMRAKAETWASGLRTDTPDMTFHFPPDGLVIHGAPFPVPPGRYVLSADSPWYIRGVLLLFHKQNVTLLGPEA
jgi:hypothetical protein